MSISKFATYINPLLSALKKLGGSARPSEVCTVIARDLALPDSGLEKRLKMEFLNSRTKYTGQDSISPKQAILTHLGTEYGPSQKRGVPLLHLPKMDYGN